MSAHDGHGNPYASLTRDLDQEEESEKTLYEKKSWADRKALPLFKLGSPATPQNRCEKVETAPRVRHPYAFLTQNIEIEAQLEQSLYAPKPWARRIKFVSKEMFRSRCRNILRQYQPMAIRRGRLQPELHEFIEVNANKSGETREAILKELERYDLTSMGSLNPQLNREGKTLLPQLEKILRKYPA